MVVYYLEHCVELNGYSDDYKVIGLFTTKEKAEEALQVVRNKPGFRDYPDDCFIIDSRTLGTLNWTEGWTVWPDWDDDVEGEEE